MFRMEMRRSCSLLPEGRVIGRHRFPYRTRTFIFCAREQAGEVIAGSRQTYSARKGRRRHSTLACGRTMGSKVTCSIRPYTLRIRLVQKVRSNTPPLGTNCRVHSTTKSPPCPGRGDVGHTIDRCITTTSSYNHEKGGLKKRQDMDVP